MVTIGEKYVERVEKALVETLVLVELRSMQNQTIDALATRIRSVGGFDARVDDKFVRDSVKRLARDGHVTEENDRYTLTDDGREDVTKLENVLRNVVGELDATTATGRTVAGSTTTRTGVP